MMTADSSPRIVRHFSWTPTVAGRCLVRLVCALLLAGASAAQAQVRDWPLELPPRPLSPRDVSFPPYEVRTLANGMQVMTVLHHEQPAVTMRLLVRAGAAQDPTGKDGLAFLAAQLLDQGTTTKSASQIADEIDLIGGAMGTAALPDLTSANVIVMKDSFDAGMRMLADVVRNPAFAQEEIDRQKKQILSSLQVSADDPEYVANTVFDRLVYGQHPYGLPGTGTTQTIATITRDDLRAFHRRYFVPNNMILAIVGDVTGPEASAAAERVFGSWPRVNLTFDQPVEPPTPSRRVIIVDKPDAVQTEIRVGQLAIPRKHPDYMAWDLAIKILGGEGANRLHGVLRSQRGLTYGASADTEAMKQAGDFVAETDTRTETTVEALALMIEEMVRLQRQPVPVRELANAQDYLAGSFPLTIETPNDIAVQVLNAMFYELPLQEISNFRERVTAVTPADIQRVAQQYIRTDRLSIVLVGNARGFLPQLKQLGPVEFELIPIGDLDLMEPSLRRGRVRVSNDVGPGLSAQPRIIPASFSPQTAQPPSAPRRPAPTQQPSPAPAPAPAPAGRGSTTTAPAGAAPRTDAAAAELLRRVVAARGGLEALKSVRSVVAETDTRFMDETGKEAAVTRTKTYVLYPDKFRVDAFIQGDQVIQIFNGGRAWEKSPGGVREMPTQVRDDAAASVKRDTIPLLIAAAEGRLTVRVLPDQPGSDGKSLRVLELSGPDIDSVQLTIDDQMLIVRQVFWTIAPQGRSGLTMRVRAEEQFSDYRTVSGVKVPYEASVVRDGKTLVKRVLTSVTFNDPAVVPSLFEKPS
jgi:zinc protease